MRRGPSGGGGGRRRLGGGGGRGLFGNGGIGAGGREGAVNMTGSSNSSSKLFNSLDTSERKLNKKSFYFFL